MMSGQEPSCLQPKLILMPPASGSTLSVVGPSGPGTCFQVPNSFSQGFVLSSVTDCRAARTPDRDRHNKPLKNNPRRIFTSSPWKWTGSGEPYLRKILLSRRFAELRCNLAFGKSGTEGTFSSVRVISIVWLVMIGDFQSRGNFPPEPPATYSGGE